MRRPDVKYHHTTSFDVVSSSVMVNTGQPSRACDPCKERHTKCDERRPQCSRCEKAGRKCTGYKNDFDINLRNETHVVARRVRARETYFQRLQTSLPVPAEQQAIALFFENFVLEPSDSRYSRGFLAGLAPLLRTARPDSVLSSTVEAVGLCFLERSVGSNLTASRAGPSYVRCLNILRTTLLHEEDSVSTETMISVYLMGLYEIMMPPKKDLHPWLAHLNGLTAIQKARNKKTGLCFPGFGVVGAPNSALDGSSWVVNINSPADGWLVDDSGKKEGILYSECVTGRALRSISFANGPSIHTSIDGLVLRAQHILQVAPSLLESLHPEATANVRRLLSAARSLLSSFEDWPSRIPDDWQPRTMNHQIDASELSSLDIYPGRIDVYPDLYVAAVWNTYRTTLLRLCDVIAQCGQYLETDAMPFGETAEYQVLRTIASKTAEDICSSVACHINNDWMQRIAATSFQRSPKALGGLHLTWPLYAGSVLSIVPDVHRGWMRRKLRSIGVAFGLAQAIVLADTVDLRTRTDPFKPLILAQGHVFMWSASMF
ncbi:hypothetical protein EDD37DRAFT_294274 [Exophiala viscosa]|uniref:Zn(2)-C6 fungal-type domain-containing protein n=1 Tax=Exophiala viscosa TaxID=2486360 RepID=A0AAN6II57_9EURO|nr:hypothetical protein EDD36DRAFT_47357 [Exophiala viscosa]KAI1628128.1 hypothetical protein EDD37DRAFT_294274 [Exophiala viscosa]